ncbi:hypothetical protein RQP46_002668 [Phenoliferia psychrophenolica]
MRSISTECVLTPHEDDMFHVAPSGDRLCQRCKRHIGPGTGVPCFKCSKCNMSYYCSRECQVTHWKDHKELCKRRKYASDHREEDALAGPGSWTAHSDMADWAQLIREEAVYAIRTPLRIGRRNPKNKTHVIILRFTHLGNGPDLRSRIRFDSGFDISTQSMLESTRGQPAEAEWLNLHNVQNKTPPRPGEVFVCIIFHFDWRPDPIKKPNEWQPQATFHPIWVNPRIWEHAMPLKKRRMLPDWEKYLAKVLSGPLPRDEEEMEEDELRASEEEVRGEWVGV